MEQEYVEQFGHILENISLGVTMLDAHSLRICYANQYIRAQLTPLHKQLNIIGCQLADVLSPDLEQFIRPALQQVAITGKSQQFDELPFEGLLESRGRTYWRVSIERHIPSDTVTSEAQARPLLLITLEDVTESVRSRLHVQAIHTISSTISGPSTLQFMLDRILQVLQDIFGSKRCAIYLFDQALAHSENARLRKIQTLTKPKKYRPATYTAHIVAQKGLYGNVFRWRIQVDDHVLLNDIVEKRRTCIITDTRTRPELHFPDLDYQRGPCRPRSVLSVPIFAPDPEAIGSSAIGNKATSDIVLGTIEVYHRGARAFPAEEVELLEQFSHQVGLAIQIESEVIARTTELKQRNKALQKLQREQANTNARLALLLESLPVSIILVSAKNNRIMVINRQAIQLFQHLGIPLKAADEIELTKKYTIGMNCEQLVQATAMYGPGGTCIPYKEHPLFAALKQGQHKEMELHTQINGQLIYLLAQASPLYTTEGNISSAILVYQDITRMKQLEHTREDFFTTMAHELKTPLANIRAHLSALLTQDLHWSNEEQQDFLQTADQQVDRLVGMINHFLDASRVEAGALRLELEPIIIPELFEDLQDRLEALINTSRCRLAIFMPEQLPAIQGDYELIMSVLTNLLSNAFRYAPENDAVHLCADPIFDRSKQRLSGIKFSVIDHGPGISKEQQGALFTRFSTFAELTQSAINDPAQPELTRHQKNTRWSPGTGLGLYISRGILEAHGSQLQLISSPGNGAQFTFTLPVYKKQGKRHRASSLAGVFRVE